LGAYKGEADEGREDAKSDVSRAAELAQRRDLRVNLKGAAQLARR
jgi:hypothetical protein